MIKQALLITVWATLLQGQMTLSEVMVNPQGLETANEFLEIHSSATNEVSLIGWIISDGAGVDTLIHWFGPDSIAPNGFGLILDPDYDTDNGIYSEQLSNSIPVFTSGTDGSLGSGGFTNSGESAFLISPAGDTVSQFTWLSSPPNGYSFEKILMTASDEPSNWAVTTVENGTPGAVNAVSPPLVNCGLDSIHIFSLPANANGSALVHIYLHNGGLQNIDSIGVSLGLDENQDGEIQINEPLLQTILATDLAWNDTLSVLIETPPLQLGINQLIGEIIVPEDTILADNTIVFEVVLPIPAGTIKLNELLYQPAAGGTEFIELINTGPDTLNLQRWRIQDATNSTAIFPDVPIKLAPQEFAVVAPNSTIEPMLPSAHSIFIVPTAWPSLNNSSDSIRISDSEGQRLETAWYSSNWGGGTGVSLERRATWLALENPQNWGSCILPDGNSVGAVNSIVVPQFGAALRILMSPEHPRRLEDFNISVQIIGTGQFPSPNALLTLAINDEHVSSQAVIIPAFQDTAQFVFENIRLTMGTHDLRMSLSGAVNTSMSDSVRITPRPGDVRINEFLPWPNSGDPEWVELFNFLGESIPVNVLSLGDGGQLNVLSGEDSIPANGYLVISEFDLEFFECDVTADTWPGFTNNADEIVLGDSHGNRLDSLHYNAGWHITQNASMERIWPDSSTTELNNWALNVTGGSPCEMNVATPRPIDLMISSLQFTREFLLRGDEDSVEVLIQNGGYQTSSPAALVWRLDGLSGSIPIPPINGFDSVRAHILLEFHTGGFQPLQLEITTTGDGILWNNLYNDTIPIGYPTGCIAINEIAPTPVESQPEYVELVSQDTAMIDLAGWSIRDAGQQRHLFNDSLMLHPAEYLILTASNALDSYFNLQNIAVIVPESWPTLNNSTDSVVVLDAVGHTVAQIGYNTTWGTNLNASLERRALWLPGQNGENWGSCLSPEGGTPGLPNSIARLGYAVVFDSISIPTGLNYVTPISISVDLTSQGHFAESGELRLSIDGRLILSQTTPEIQFDDMTSQTFTLDPITPGEHQLNLIYDGTSTATLDTNFWVGVRSQDIIINEMMVWPDVGEPEWVELLNRSTQSIPLNLLGISDVSHIAWCDTITIINPGDYLTLVQDFSQNGCEAIVRSWPGFGNQSDAIRILDRTGTVIDSLAYHAEWNLTQGRSFERIWPDSSTHSASNWTAHPDYGSPCELNRATPPAIDLAILSLELDTATCRTDTESNMLLKITNLGYASSSTGEIFVSIDSGMTHTGSVNMPAIVTGDTTEIGYVLTWDSPGNHLVQCWLEVSDDPYLSNDSLELNAFVAYPDPSLLITEIMYLPFPGNPEWVEIYNAWSDTIDIANWYVADATDEAWFDIEADSIYQIAPGDYAVIQGEGNPTIEGAFVLPNFPNLNNTGDFLSLLDPLNNVVDSLTFSSAWGGQTGISLERIRLTDAAGNPRNWSSSIAPAGATPGAQNSLYLVEIPTQLTLALTPNPFSPDGDGYQDIQQISFSLPFESGTVSVEIFDVLGRKMVTLASNQPTPAIGTLAWNGDWDFGDDIRMGIYILKFRVDDQQGHVYERLVKSYVARR